MKAENIAIFVAIGIAGAIAVGVFVANYPGSTQGNFIAKCEENMLARLKAPSTYERIKVEGPRYRSADSAEIMALSAEERKGFRDLNAELTGGEQTFHSNKLGFVYFRFTYDAANAYGTPIRGTFTCEQMVYARETLTDDGGPRVRMDEG